MAAKSSSFTQEKADEICAWISAGNSLRSWCMQEGHEPYGTVYDWLEQHSSFAAAYARAREVQAHNDADRINDVMARCEALQLPPDVTRVVVDALKWTAARRAPKVYGDKVALSGNDGAPIVVRWADGSD